MLKFTWLSSFLSGHDLILVRKYSILFIFFFRDRRWAYDVCKFTVCTSNKIKILDAVKPTSEKERVVGVSAAQICDPGATQMIKIEHQDNMEERASFTISKDEEFNWGASIEVGGEVAAGFLGSGATASFSVSASAGGAVTAGRSDTKETMKGTETMAGSEVEYQGPRGGIIIASTKEYKLDRSNVNVEVDVTCDDGTTFKRKSKMALQSTSFGKTHFTTRLGKFNNQKDCTWDSEQCIRNLKFGYAFTDLRQLIAEFRQCFNNIGTVAK